MYSVEDLNNYYENSSVTVGNNRIPFLVREVRRDEDGDILVEGSVYNRVNGKPVESTEEVLYDEVNWKDVPGSGYAFFPGIGAVYVNRTPLRQFKMGYRAKSYSFTASMVPFKPNPARKERADGWFRNMEEAAEAKEQVKDCFQRALQESLTGQIDLQILISHSGMDHYWVRFNDYPETPREALQRLKDNKVMSYPLSKDIALSRTIQKGIYVVLHKGYAIGVLAGSPDKLIISHRVRYLMHNLYEHFGRVVIDTQDIIPVNDHPFERYRRYVKFDNAMNAPDFPDGLRRFRRG